MTVIYSYVPFLQNNSFLEHTNFEQTLELLKKHPSGVSNNCCWSTHNNEPLAILVFDNAKALYEDVMSFCKGFPNKYFNLEFGCHKDSYAIGLVPDLEYTTQVVNRMRMMQGKMPILKPEIAYVPLYFSCKTSQVLHELKIDETIVFGLLDTKHMVDGNIDTSNVMVVGEFPISECHLINDIIEDMTNEVISSIVN